MREKQRKIAFLFGLDDHWGPLQMFDEVIIIMGFIIIAFADCCTNFIVNYFYNRIYNAFLITKNKYAYIFFFYFEKKVEGQTYSFLTINNKNPSKARGETRT